MTPANANDIIDLVDLIDDSIIENRYNEFVLCGSLYFAEIMAWASAAKALLPALEIQRPGKFRLLEIGLALTAGGNKGR